MRDGSGRLLAVAVLLAVLTGCGGGVTGGASATMSTTTSEAAADGPTTLAKGEDVELVGDDGLAGQTLNINAEEENGEVTGEFRVTDVRGHGRVRGHRHRRRRHPRRRGDGDPGADVAVGDLLALIIREGDPDSVALFANDNGAGSCTELLKSIPDNQRATSSTSRTAPTSRPADRQRSPSSHFEAWRTAPLTRPITAGAL